MTQQYFIRNLLNIKDSNINILEDYLTFEYIKGDKYKIIHAELVYYAEKCPYCQSREIIKWGTKTTNIKILKISSDNSILRLKKQRFKCKCCGKTFIAETDFVDKNCSISNDVKLAVTLKLKNNTSEKHIAQDLKISNRTVNRVVTSFYK